MNNKNIGWLVLLIILMLPFSASAATAKVYSGVLPNSFWFWADDFGEQLRFFFTPGNESKVRYLDRTLAERQSEKDDLNAQGIAKFNDEIDKKINDMKVLRERFSGNEAQPVGSENSLTKFKSYFK